jgi:phosphohistidine swiveling domain-containing protein
MTNRTMNISQRGFPSPFESPIPDGCAGWEDLYAYHTRFSEDRRAFDEDRFWFQDGLHTPEPLYPFDAIVFEWAVVALNQAASRLFAVPPSLGAEFRNLYGYTYISANSVTDETTLGHRGELFARRGGYYYEHWDELYDRWVGKVEAATQELQALEVPELSQYEDESVVSEGRGVGSSYLLLAAYDRLLEGLDRILQYHFELLNLGYGAYLAFYELCRSVFPEVDDQTLAKMVTGIDVLVLRPDEELKRLARLALELGIGDLVKGTGNERELRAALADDHAAAQWLADYEDTKDPWFYFSYGLGTFYHHHRSWIDDPALPIVTIGEYVERLEAGEDIERPVAGILAERERITAGYRELLSEETRAVFDRSLGLARTVFPYVENHNFYIDHRYLTIFWNKVREFGALLSAHHFLVDAEDIFLLRHDEVRSALEDLRLSWSSGGGVARGPAYWPPLVERRRSIYQAMRRWSPPPALGRIPDEITEPITVMLWGITTERVEDWLSSKNRSPALTGTPASSGVAEGRARVILGGEGLDRLEDGEILVAQTTSTSWTPYFAKIAAAVLDVGGVMCHAAIVAREYSLPAVVGTGTGTKQIRTGDRIRVDADAGTVTFIQRVPLDSTQRPTGRPLTDRKERHMPTGQEGSA